MFLAPVGIKKYSIDKSIRFRAAPYLSRTFGTPTANTAWTFSCWMKRSKLVTAQTIFSGNLAAFGFNTSDQLVLWNNAGSPVSTSTALYRDPSAWGHLVVNSNGTTVTFYWNGVSALTYAGTVTNINTTTAHYLGCYSNAFQNPVDGYLAEIYFVDGQALLPTDFGQFDNNGTWIPKKYTGTYGNNGFYLPFKDDTSRYTLGADQSGSNVVSTTATASDNSTTLIVASGTGITVAQTVTGVGIPANTTATSYALRPNTNQSEATVLTGIANTSIDFVSNGIKFRDTTPASGEITFGTRTYIYAAFAEAPFGGSNVSPATAR